MAWAAAKKQAFWKPGEAAPGGLPAERAEGSQAELDIVPHNKFGAMPISSQRARLPIFKCRESLLYLLQQHATVRNRAPSSRSVADHMPVPAPRLWWSGRRDRARRRR